MAADLVPVPAAQLERFRELGLDVDAVLRRANLPRSRFAAAKPAVTTAEFFALWRAVDELAPEPDLGLRIGTASSQPSVGSIAALHSATFGDALAKLARYKRLVCPEEITIEVRRDEARVRFEWVLADGESPRLLIDGVFASVVNLARRGSGMSITPRRIELARRRAHEVMLRRHFGCAIRFDAPADVLVFDASALATPFATHAPELLALVVPGLEEALRSEHRRTLADDVRAALGHQINGERPAVERVAKALGMSSRTLQRRLTELGTSYQHLLDDVRHRSARRMLANTDLDAGEVAFLLGFEELNSFTRAFHEWEGTTPTRWRTKQPDRGKGAIA